MSNRHIDRTERPRDEGIYSSYIERDKKEKGKYSETPPEENKQLLLATFFSYLKKMFDAFSPSKGLAGKVIDRQSIIANLTEFKKLLLLLGGQNLSNSSEFATKLSVCWSKLTEDLETLQVLQRKNLQEVAAFRNLIDQIKNYPPDSEHRLGYYLYQHAGKDWLPFPFIEMLEKLHTENHTDSKTGTLSIWVNQIDQIITELKNQVPFKLS